MIHTSVLSRDPLTKRTTYWHFDDATGQYHIETVTDIEDILEHNKSAFAQIDQRATWHDEMNLIAQIPIGLLFELKRKGIYEEEDPKKKRLMKWLDDPENQFFRFRPGLLSR